MTKTTSLETSRLLQESGFEVETERRWVHFKAKKTVMESKIDNWKVVNEDWDAARLGYAAPTTDELLEEIPWRINDNHNPSDLMITRGPKNFTVRYVNAFKIPFRSTPDRGFVNENLCECLAKCWLYLKQQGLLNKE